MPLLSSLGAERNETRVMITSMTKHPRDRRPPEGKPDPDLRDLALMTTQMRSLEDQRATIGEKRRKRVVYLHSQDVSCAAMARAMDLTEAAVNKMVHGGPTARANKVLARKTNG
jgi:hypothetical protein